MPQKILQVNFTFNMSRDEYEQICQPMAPDLAETPGLRWKVWIMNEQRREAGGIYLFEDESSVQAFVAALTVILDSPAFGDIRMTVFDIIENLTRITRGPIHEIARPT